MRNLVSDFIPPVLIKTLRKAIRKKKFGSAKIESYQDSDLIKLVLYKNLQLRSTPKLTNLDALSFRTIAAVGIGIGSKSNLTVLDFGGGAGHHQFLAKNIFKKVKFDWMVLETGAMCEIAQTEIKDEGLNFLADLSSLSGSTKFDLIFSNSAIQYTKDPIDTLRKLLSLNFDYFFITRIPLTLSINPITYMQESLLSQNGPGPAPKDFQDKLVKYSNQIASKESFEEVLNERLDDWTSVNEGPWDIGRFGEKVMTYSYFGSAKYRGNHY